MSATTLPASTKICVFRNGDRNYFGKTLVVHRRQLNDMDRLLDSITTTVGLQEAARYLCTPVGGTRITALDQLQPAGNYVAVTKGKFRKLPYLDLEAAHSEWLKSCSKRRQRNIKPAERQIAARNAPSRLIGTTRGGIYLFVFCNSYMYESARRIYLREHVLSRKWKDICAEISENLEAPFGALRGLYTLDGVRVNGSAELLPNSRYVAVGRFTPFQMLNYGTVKPPFAVSANVHQKESEPVWTAQPSVNDEESDTIQTESSEQSKRQTTATAGTGQKRHRLPPVIFADGRSVFHAKPTAHKRRQAKTKTIDLDRDEGGVFKAGPRDETRDAEEIEETPLTVIDEPVDNMPAKQVEDEEKEGNEMTGGGDRGTAQRPEAGRYVSSVVYGDVGESGDVPRAAHSVSLNNDAERTGPRDGDAESEHDGGPSAADGAPSGRRTPAEQRAGRSSPDSHHNAKENEPASDAQDMPRDTEETEPAGDKEDTPRGEKYSPRDVNTGGDGGPLQSDTGGAHNADHQDTDNPGNPGNTVGGGTAVNQ